MEGLFGYLSSSIAPNSKLELEEDGRKDVLQPAETRQGGACAG